jgi:predicted glycogen debranching enzyme
MTWMDAIVDGNPVTLRGGKAVEIEALWYNALMIMAKLAPKFGEHGLTYQKAAVLCKTSFNAKFWNASKNYLFDIVDWKDASVRPNALFAISLPFAVLNKEKWQAVVDTASQELLTPYGMRTLGKSEPQYRGYLGLGPKERDLSYHNGDVWPWLLGAFADAYSRAYPHKKLTHLLAHLLEASEKGSSIGTINEVFAGDQPYAPEGCISQAWSVGELLRIIAENPVEV